ncbi:hypothetical protein CSPX01_11782 [Colletotrichum filicis]|nr:hypothetical protein CSPX01_11782 [Colletotrichum filicis]
MFSNINSKDDACLTPAEDHSVPYPPFYVSDLGTLLGILLAGSYVLARFLFEEVRNQRHVCCIGLGANDRLVEHVLAIVISGIALATVYVAVLGPALSALVVLELAAAVVLPAACLRPSSSLEVLVVESANRRRDTCRFPKSLP